MGPPDPRPPPGAPAARGQARRAWPLVLALGLVVLLAIGAIGYLVINQLVPTRPPAPAAAPQPAPAATAAAPDLARLAADANAALAGFACARLRATVAAPAAIAVSGYVGADADAKAAVARLAALPGAGPVTPPSRSCRRRSARCSMPCRRACCSPPARRRGSPSAAPPASITTATICWSTVTAPTAYDGYLSIDYIDGQEKIAIHLLPNDLRADNHVIAGQQVVIGALPPEVARYGFRPPYGTNLIIVVSTRRPLFDAPISKFSELNQYLPKLAQALQAQPDAVVAYGTVVGAP